MEKKFKPFEKVLVRLIHNQEWQCDFYSHQDSITKHHTTVGYGEIKDDNILPYEGNEHLVGTDLPADEEVRLEEGEWVMVCDKIEGQQDEWNLRYFLWADEDKLCIQSVRFAYPDPCPYNYAIRFSDFNPNDMEATKAKILCVKNGKIIRYKG